MWRNDVFQKKIYRALVSSPMLFPSSWFFASVVGGIMAILQLLALLQIPTTIVSSEFLTPHVILCFIFFWMSCNSILWWPCITRFMSSPMLFHFIYILCGYRCCGGGCFASLSIIASFINNLFQVSSTPYRCTHVSSWSCITILSLLLKPQPLMIMKNAIFSNF